MSSYDQALVIVTILDLIVNVKNDAIEDTCDFTPDHNFQDNIQQLSLDQNFQVQEEAIQPRPSSRSPQLWAQCVETHAGNGNLCIFCKGWSV